MAFVGLMLFRAMNHTNRVSQSSTLRFRVAHLLNEKIKR